MASFASFQSLSPEQKKQHLERRWTSLESDGVNLFINSKMKTYSASNNDKKESTPSSTTTPSKPTSWELGKRTVEIVSPMLEQKINHMYLSLVKDYGVCLHLFRDQKTQELFCEIVPINTQTQKMGDAQVILSDKTQITNLATAFVCDFPDALFSIDGGLPILMVSQSTNAQRYITLHNIQEAVEQNNLKFAVVVPKKKDS